MQLISFGKGGGGGSGGGGGGGLQAANNLSDVASASASLANLAGAPAASPTFTGQAKFNTLGYTLDSVTESGGIATVDWGTSGNFQKLTLVGAACTLTMTPPTNPGPVIFEVKQPSSGGPCIVTWPSNVAAAGGSSTLVLSTVAGALDLLTGVWDGTQFILAVSYPNVFH